MSNQAARLRRVPMSRASVRADISVRELDRELTRFRPATAAAARVVFWEA